MTATDLRSLPKGIWIALGLALLNAGIYALALLPLEEETEMVVSQSAQADGAARRLRSQAQNIRRDIAEVKTLQAEYDAVRATSFLQPQDRLTAVNQLDALRLKHHLPPVTYRFDGEEAQAVDRPGTVSQEFELVFTPVFLEGSALLDTDLFAFWDEALRSVPARYRINRFRVVRSGELDRQIVNDLRVGKSAELVKGSLEFDWISLRKRQQGAAPGQTGGTR